MTYIFNIILCVSIMYFFYFFAISFAEVIIKHVKVIILENYSECKTKHVLIKKVVTRFDKKNSDMAEKEH